MNFHTEQASEVLDFTDVHPTTSRTRYKHDVATDPCLNDLPDGDDSTYEFVDRQSTTTADIIDCTMQIERIRTDMVYIPAAVVNRAAQRLPERSEYVCDLDGEHFSSVPWQLPIKRVSPTMFEEDGNFCSVGCASTYALLFHGEAAQQILVWLAIRAKRCGLLIGQRSLPFAPHPRQLKKYKNGHLTIEEFRKFAAYLDPTKPCPQLTSLQTWIVGMPFIATQYGCRFSDVSQQPCADDYQWRHPYCTNRHGSGDIARSETHHTKQWSERSGTQHKDCVVPTQSNASDSRGENTTTSVSDSLVSTATHSQRTSKCVDESTDAGTCVGDSDALMMPPPSGAPISRLARHKTPNKTGLDEDSSTSSRKQVFDVDKTPLLTPNTDSDNPSGPDGSKATTQTPQLNMHPTNTSIFAQLLRQPLAEASEIHE